jgi:hypothetical protein
MQYLIYAMFLELVVLVSAEDLTKEGIIGRRKK